MPKLIDHQTRFISFLMGGPASYTDEHIAHVHASWASPSRSSTRCSSC